MKLNLRPLVLLVALPQLSFGQTLETFESVTQTTVNQRPTTFTSNGQSFTTTSDNCGTGGIFGVWIPGQQYANCNGTNSTNSTNSYYGVGASCTGTGNCTDYSAQFIDNGLVPPAVATTGHVYGLKTTNGAPFTVKSIFIYLSTDNGTNPSSAGGVTITGKLAGNTVFTYTKTTGFATNFTNNSGFTFIDFSAGTNYSNSNIDQLLIQSPNANYVALDNFKWGASIPLPLGLLSFDLKKNGNTVYLNWKAASNAAIMDYQIERSTDGKLFSRLGNMTVNNSGNYQFPDLSPLAGDNFYRLAITSKDGNVTYSDVKGIFMSTKEKADNLLYPNPTTGILFAKVPGAAVWNIQITDITGRMVSNAKFSAQTNSLSIASLPNTIYFYKLSDANTGVILEEGKINKL
ncbi:T9SS type A sorting domain-containing protein [Taibaiella chishuiensis]|uniref:Putative secreted protein (Por secretion system target) n=1 Tax=Taibaiella chishuiensis TaxID=1434707 RepID=A0A2P8CX69_9BACT|nr:T9SS type A sorting domain-containing protein [Taibaiella chishuiensis]PSK89572.1 putative secreted protein (Por secretion system target) [Taibaiella chishuiensis]